MLRLLDEMPDRAQALLGIIVEENLNTESGREYLQQYWLTDKGRTAVAKPTAGAS